MTSIDKTAVNPRGTRINFSEKDHLYWTDHKTPEHVSGDKVLQVKYQSVTTMLKHHFEPFDEKATSEQVAVKRGVPAAVILTEWEMTRNTASRFGTRVHAICEDCLNGKPPRFAPENEKERSVMRHGWEFALNVRKEMTVIGAEMIIFHEALQLAGTIDFAARDKNGVLWLMDWKTNKEIRTSNSYGKTGLGVIAHLPECEMTKYALQLSTYETILKADGYIGRAEKVNRAIVHLTEAGAALMTTPNYGVEVCHIMLEMATALPF